VGAALDGQLDGLVPRDILDGELPFLVGLRAQLLQPGDGKSIEARDDRLVQLVVKRFSKSPEDELYFKGVGKPPLRSSR